jgi:hypothetical protein
VLATVLEYLPAVVGVAVGAWYPVAFLRTARRAHDAEGRAADRIDLVDRLVASLLALLVAWLWVPWQVVPPLLWSVLVLVDAYALLLAAAAWRGLPWAGHGEARRRVTSSVAGAAVVAGIFTLVLR